MKETAVEWFAYQLEKGITGDNAWYDVLNKAKAMEKEQVVDAFMNGADVGDMFNNEGRAFITDAEKYYNETYGKDESEID